MSDGFKRKIHIVPLLLLIAAAVLIFFPKDEAPAGGALRAGCGDDITGVFMDEICRIAEEEGQGETPVSSYAFADCCGSSAQWALETKEIDLGFYCSEAALAMVNALPEYEIYAPAVMNCEIVALEKGTDPGDVNLLAMPRGRGFLRDHTAERWPDSFSDVGRGYLMYAVRSGDADGAVVDISEARALSGEADFYPLSDRDYVSYCLVVRKDITGSREFSDFLHLMNLASKSLNDPARRTELMGMDEAFWQQSGLLFLDAE